MFLLDLVMKSIIFFKKKKEKKKEERKTYNSDAISRHII
jgi:hypothetical protein